MTPNTPQKDNNTTLIRAVFFVAILIIATVIIVFLKQESNDGPLTPEGLAARDSLRNIAKPDIPESPEATPLTPFTNTGDSITTDLRTPADAGYEDGYYAGLIDGVTGDERASYDESSQFPQPNQRRNYAEAYRRGYAQGYADGEDGKQFGVVNDSI